MSANHGKQSYGTSLLLWWLLPLGGGWLGYSAAGTGGAWAGMLAGFVLFAVIAASRS